MFSYNTLTLYSAIVGYIRHDADVICSACSASYRQNQKFATKWYTTLGI